MSKVLCIRVSDEFAVAVDVYARKHGLKRWQVLWQALIRFDDALQIMSIGRRDRRYNKGKKRNIDHPILRYDNDPLLRRLRANHQMLASYRAVHLKQD